MEKVNKVTSGKIKPKHNTQYDTGKQQGFDLGYDHGFTEGYMHGIESGSKQMMHVLDMMFRRYFKEDL
jgi:flagellar biosynthesis/type III secretory pathway protein FliH